MANKKSNFPNAVAERQLQQNPEFVSQTISSLMEIAKQDKPKDIAELKKRVHDYFQFCDDRKFKPGIESLCLSLGCVRNTFHEWRRGSKGEEWANICEYAHQVILCFIESANMNGKINPVSAIFLLKAVGGYSDVSTLEIKRTDDLEFTEESIKNISERLPQLEGEYNNEES